MHLDPFGSRSSIVLITAVRLNHQLYSIPLPVSRARTRTQLLRGAERTKQNTPADARVEVAHCELAARRTRGAGGGGAGDTQTGRGGQWV